MSVPEHLAHYSALLQIRRRAGRRDVTIAGGVFLVTVLATASLGLLGGIGGRSAYLVVAIEVALGLGFVTTWVRLAINRALIELVDHLQRATASQRSDPE